MTEMIGEPPEAPPNAAAAANGSTFVGRLCLGGGGAAAAAVEAGGSNSNGGGGGAGFVGAESSRTKLLEPSHRVPSIDEFTPDTELGGACGRASLGDDHGVIETIGTFGDNDDEDDFDSEDEVEIDDLTPYVLTHNYTKNA